MHRPFVRATLVLILLVCGGIGHGWHAQDDSHASTVTHASHHTAPDIDRATAVLSVDSTVIDQASQSSTDSAARNGHAPEDHACGTAGAADKAHSPGVPDLCKLEPPAANSGREESPVAAPTCSSGRSLLLLQCISRT
jgi:hypothetical protein